MLSSFTALDWLANNRLTPLIVTGAILIIVGTVLMILRAIISVLFRAWIGPAIVRLLLPDDMTERRTLLSQPDER